MAEEREERLELEDVCKLKRICFTLDKLSDLEFGRTGRHDTKVSRVSTEMFTIFDEHQTQYRKENPKFDEAYYEHINDGGIDYSKP